ncbi:MAG TPA: hypothetical protein IAC95_02600 [Candidatus Fimimonas gallinarum]|uniref:Uncharacterized protein n=1 Tax=Candidatus Fimimonas gallinarum TaxID=2840821 RepID=A0A9D1E449_9BACT|nr:hypothetical protein [Candidatus Fimimonas gallinarum]
MSTAKTPNLQPPRNVNTLANQRQTAAQRRMKAQRAKKTLKTYGNETQKQRCETLISNVF